MTVASPLHVRIPVRRKPKNRRLLKAAGFGLAAALIVPLTLAATLVGVSRMRPASMEMRADLRFSGTYGPASGRLVWSTLSNDAMQSPFYLAEAETSAASVAALVSLPENAERLDEPKFTGSLGPKVVVPERILRPAANPRLDAERPQPRARESAKENVKESTKPQPKQKLAALSPVEIGTKPPQQEEAPPKTAYYDITAKIVYMPGGERLEAHSGLGRYMDDPRHFKLKMRGVTPPNTYRLRERERLFHGVRAIRLIPEDDKAMYGRDGILAHTYMLGTSGQSNGCVSFKYYDKFLQAFLRGEVERLVVVVKMDKPPVFARRTMKSAANTN
jgi:hypothetical protein